MSKGLIVYDLTPLTRGAAEQRRAVIQGFEVRWRPFLIGVIGLVPSFLLTALLWPWIGSFAILSGPILIGATIWLVEGRARRGQRLRNWASLKNRLTSSTGSFFVSGTPFDPLHAPMSLLQSASLPVEQRPATDAEEMAALEGREIPVVATDSATLNGSPEW